MFVSKAKGKEGGEAKQDMPLITFSARQVSLYDALTIICDLGELTFKLRGDMVVVSPKGEQNEKAKPK